MNLFSFPSRQELQTKIKQFLTNSKDKFYAFLQLIKKHKWISLAAGIVTALFMFVYMIQNRMIYFPSVSYPRSPAGNPNGYKNPGQMNLFYQNLELTTSDNIKLRGWHVKAINSKRIVLYFHQNAENIGTRMQYIRNIVNKTQSDVIIVAYRGYSDSQGKPSQKGIKKDVQCIINAAITKAQQSNLPIYLLGRSLGGATASYAASLPNLQNKIDGIILQNTFTSIGDVVTHLFIPHLINNMFTRTLIKPLLWVFLRNHWNTLAIIKKINAPILFIKAAKDQLIPKAQMDKLSQQAQLHHKKHFEVQLINGTHNETWSLDPEFYFERFCDFFYHIQEENKNKKFRQKL